MKKGRMGPLPLVVAIVILTVLTGGVVAYMFRTTADKQNQFTPAEVSCEVKEVFDSDKAEKSSIRVQNTGNIDAYLRLRLVSYWVKVEADGSETIASKVSEMPEITPADGWIAGADSTYYYALPIAPGAMTPEFLETGTKIVLRREDEYRQVVDVFAEAIQSVPEKAVEESWGVTIEGGSIRSVGSDS